MTTCRTKGTVSEDEVYTLIQRYGASAIFTLLQETSHATEKDAKIDWRTLAKETSTGISNAREYQMLWRHLAYRDPLEKVEDGGEPLSDESDLEFELEAAPSHSEIVSAEVDCCVKVILSSGSVGDCGSVDPLNVEAPPTADTTNDQTSVVLSDKQHLDRNNRATNGAPFNPQKQPLSNGLPNEGFDGNASSNSGVQAKKKRKVWTKEEDMELIAAVEKYGEGNWANILKGDFKHDRTASQLSQRWANIRKRTASKQSNGSKARSEEMLAAQKALSMALNMPMSGSLATIYSGGTQMHTANSSITAAGGTSGALDESLASASQASKQNHQPVNQETLSQKVLPNHSNKPRTVQKKPPSPQLKPSICPNPLIKAAAFAAGGRIAPPLTAASLFKAAQSKSAVHIRHGGRSSLIGSSVTNTISSSSPTATATTVISTAPMNTATAGSHTLNSRFIHPSVSLISSGCGITSKLCQVQTGSGKPPSLPPSEPRLGVMASCSLHENGRRRRSVNSSAIDADDLLVEEGRGEPSDEASDKLVQAINGSSVAAEINCSSVFDIEMNENQCTETDQVQRQNLKEEQSGEGKISVNSGDSKLDEEVILHS